MSVFADYLKQLKEDERRKRGRPPLRQDHDADVDFVKLKDKDIRNFTQKIRIERNKRIKALKRADANLTDEILNQMDLSALDNEVTARNIDLPSKQTDQEWKQHEKDVSAGVKKATADGFFYFVDENGEKHCLSEAVEVTNGGSSPLESDVAIVGKKGRFCIECKLGYDTAEYFKFNLHVSNGNIRYDHGRYVAWKKADTSDHDDVKHRFYVDALFRMIDVDGFVNDVILKDPHVEKNWRDFLRNVRDVADFIRRSDEFSDFAKGLGDISELPADFKRMTEVFDRYCQFYIDKYDKLIGKMLDLVADEDITDRRDDFMIQARTRTSDISKGEVFSTVNELIAQGEGSVTDRDMFLALADDIKKIEVRLNAVLSELKLDPYSFRRLKSIDDDKKLKYFFKFFISAVDRKNKKTESLSKNLQICPDVEIESDVLAGMITDFYAYKDQCAYAQVGDRIYAFEENRNPFRLSDLPVFKDCVRKYSVSIRISDDLKTIRLHVRGHQPDAGVLGKYAHLSFKQNDPNFIEKKLEPICVKDYSRSERFSLAAESSEIRRLSHMLDECGLTGRSYYDVYMLGHPEEEQPAIFEKLISEFALAVNRNKFDFRKCFGPNGRVVINRNVNTVAPAAKKMNFHYVWDTIRPDVYKAILSRAVHPGASRGVARKTIEDCLNVICGNTNVLDANSSICSWAADDNWDIVEKLFEKYGLPKLPTDYYSLKEDSYAAVCEVYSYWAAFQIGSGDPICNSDDGPWELRQILNECPYDADDSVLISTLNRCLDITHVRGDLALAFIEGGSRTLSDASNMAPDKLFE